MRTAGSQGSGPQAATSAAATGGNPPGLRRCGSTAIEPPYARHVGTMRGREPDTPARVHQVGARASLIPDARDMFRPDPQGGAALSCRGDGAVPRPSSTWPARPDGPCRSTNRPSCIAMTRSTPSSTSSAPDPRRLGKGGVRVARGRIGPRAAVPRDVLHPGPPPCRRPGPCGDHRGTHGGHRGRRGRDRRPLPPDRGGQGLRARRRHGARRGAAGAASRRSGRARDRRRRGLHRAGRGHAAIRPGVPRGSSGGGHREPLSLPGRAPAAGDARRRAAHHDQHRRPRDAGPRPRPRVPPRRRCPRSDYW